jgi:hypothetical protein
MTLPRHDLLTVGPQRRTSYRMNPVVDAGMKRPETAEQRIVGRIHNRTD